MQHRLITAHNLLLAAAFIGALAALLANAQAATLNTLHSFCSQANCADGDRPLAALLKDTAGNLYGTTEVGGANNSGVVFELRRKAKGWAYRVLYDFCRKADCVDGSTLDTPVILDTAGNLYGTTGTGGAFGCGTVFRLSPTAPGAKWKLQTLHDFCALQNEGRWPGSGLSYEGQASGSLYDGSSPLYGSTRLGGADGGGTVYTIAPNAKGKWKAKTLHDFCAKSVCPDGDKPLGDLLVSTSGSLFGTASSGGTGKEGVAFQLSPSGSKWTFKTLYNFCHSEGCPDGGKPVGPLLQDKSGALIGGALEPGDEGVLYRLTPHGKAWDESVLHTFCGTCTDGYDPMGGVVMDGAGDLFGTAAFGGGTGGIGSGTVFKLSGADYQVLYVFCSQQNCADGAFPEAPITLDNKGRIYGTTAGGIAEQHGSVFELIP